MNPVFPLQPAPAGFATRSPRLQPPRKETQSGIGRQKPSAGTPVYYRDRLAIHEPYSMLQLFIIADILPFFRASSNRYVYSQPQCVLKTPDSGLSQGNALTILVSIRPLSTCQYQLTLIMKAMIRRNAPPWERRCPALRRGSASILLALL